MKRRGLMIFSLLANVALVAFILRTGRAPGSVVGDLERSRASATSEATRLKTNLTRIEVTLTNDAPPFHWRDVASEDFKQYVAGLRSIGCPPETVRDIIEAELTTIYLARRRAIVEPFQREYWTVAARGEEFDDATKVHQEAINKLEEETLDKLDDYLGGTAASKKSKKQLFDPQTAFLPEEKRKMLDYLHEQYNADKASLANLSKLTPEQYARRDVIEKEHRDSIAVLLSPEEHAEYQLRRSRHAHESHASTGFEGTPEEARSIARAYEQFPDPPDNLNRKDPEYAAKKAVADQARRQREEAVKAALGPERYAQFQQGFDGNFRDVFRITERYGLPRDSAAQAAEAMRARNETLDHMRSFGLLYGDEGVQRNLAVQRETYAALLQAMGERALRTYENYHGPIIPVQDAATGRQ